MQRKIDGISNNANAKGTLYKLKTCLIWPAGGGGGEGDGDQN